MSTSETSHDLVRSVVVFDLDDTLYQESEYVQSGKEEVIRWVRNVFGVDVSEAVSKADSDFLSAICNELGLNTSVKSSLIWIYRLHLPTLKLRSGMAALLDTLSSRGVPWCVLTDGRALTQRLKILALNIQPSSVYISELLGFEKPHPYGFQRVENDYPGWSYIYVADNPRKDFVAPKQLGWHTIGLIGNGTNVHPQDRLDSNGLVQPDLWCENAEELSKALESRIG